MKEITLKELLESGGHFGHRTVRWNPKMERYIFTAKEGTHVFDLAKTRQGLEEAVAFAKTVASQGGKVLFLGTKRQAKLIVKQTAEKAGMPYVIERWLGGTITNWEQIKKSIDKLKEMRTKREAGDYAKYTKKEQLLLDREITKLTRFFEGLVDLEGLPEVLFIVDVKREFSAALEAQRRGIKVIAMVDTNSNPDLVDYVIPINDDATKAIELVVGCIGEAIIEGKKGEAKETEKEVKELTGEEKPKKRGRKKKTE